MRVRYISIVVLFLMAGFVAFFPADGGAAASLQNEWKEITYNGGGHRMGQGGPKFMKTKELVGLAGKKSNPIVGEPSRQSFPIPILRASGLNIVFLYCRPFFRPPQPAKLFPPEYMLTMNAQGEFVELRPVSPKEFGQSHKPDEFIGSYAMPEGMTSEQCLQKMDRLYHLYDVLLPAFYSRQLKAGQEVRAAAREFTELFRMLGEQPLEPYYHFIGKDFFNWIDQVSK